MSDRRYDTLPKNRRARHEGPRRHSTPGWRGDRPAAACSAGLRLGGIYLQADRARSGSRRRTAALRGDVEVSYQGDPWSTVQFEVSPAEGDSGQQIQWTAVSTALGCEKPRRLQ